MRLLTEREISTVSAGYCPLCLSATIFLLGGSSSTALAHKNREPFYYVLGLALLGLSIASTYQAIYHSNQNSDQDKSACSHH